MVSNFDPNEVDQVIDGGLSIRKGFDTMESKATISAQRADGWTVTFELWDPGKMVNGEQVDYFIQKLSEKGYSPVKKSTWTVKKEEKPKVQIKQTAEGFKCPLCGAVMYDQRGKVSATTGKALPHFRCSNNTDCPGRQPDKNDPSRFWSYSVWDGSYEIVTA